MELQEAFNDFLRSRAAMGCSSKTVATYKGELGMLIHCLRSQGVDRTEAIEHDHLNDFLSEANNRGVNNNSLHSYRARMSAFINWCGENGHCAPDLMRKVARPRLAPRMRKTYTNDEALALLEFARLRPIPYWAAFDNALLMTLFDTGMRIGEACALNVGDVLPEGKVRLKGKGDKERYVMASWPTLEALSRYLRMRGFLRASEPLFLSSTGGRVTRAGLYRRLQRMGAQIGITVSPHRFRHTFAKMALENGANIKTLQMFLGHSKLATTDEYLQGFGNAEALKAHQDFSPVQRMFQH